MVEPTKVNAAGSPPAPTELDPNTLVGSMIDDRYRLIEHIASGGMGAVFRAEHVLMQKPMALKILRPELADADIVERFRREAQIAASLDHDNIVRVSDFGRSSNGLLFLAMELLHGESLRAYLDRLGPLGVEDALRILLPVASALDAAHARGIVHRDLKPENIHVGANGTIRVLDFGIARIASSDVLLTRIGTILGTPRYIAPEQAVGLPVDARADVYALGLLAWRMLAGRHPFEDKSCRELLLAQATEAIPKLITVRAELAEEVELLAVIERCCAKDPEQRFAHGGALKDALARCRPSARVDAAKVVGPSTRTRARKDPRRRYVAAAAIIALLAGVLLLFSGGPASRAEAMIEDGQAAAARALLERELAADPQDVELRVLYGRALHAVGGEELRGIQAYSQALAAEEASLDDDVVYRDLITDLGHEPKIASAATKLLAQIGKPAVNAVADAAEDGDGFIRLRALSLLRDLGAEDEVDRVSAFTELLAHSECDVKRSAARALGELGDRRALPALSALAEKRESRRVLGLFDSSFAVCGATEAEAAVRKIGGARAE